MFSVRWSFRDYSTHYSSRGGGGGGEGRGGGMDIFFRGREVRSVIAN